MEGKVGLTWKKVVLALGILFTFSGILYGARTTYIPDITTKNLTTATLTANTADISGGTIVASTGTFTYATIGTLAVNTMTGSEYTVGDIVADTITADVATISTNVLNHATVTTLVAPNITYGPESVIKKVYFPDTDESDHSLSGTSGTIAWINAILAASGSQGTIELPADIVYAFADDTTFGVEVNLRINPGALITPASGKTVTIYSVDAGNYQIFDTSLGGEIILGSNVPWNVAWWGGDADAVIEISETISDNTINNAYVYFPPGEYTLEATETHPGGLGTSGCVFNGVSGLTIDFSRATVKQTSVSANTPMGGVFVLYACTDANVLCGFYDGICTGPPWLDETNTMVQICGACDGVTVTGGVVNGGDSLCRVISSDATRTGDKPKNCHVQGIVKDTQYGIIYRYNDKGQTFDLIFDDLLRGIFVSGGGEGITGNITGYNFVGGTAVVLGVEDNDYARDININMNVDHGLVGFRITAGTGNTVGYTVENVRISGIAKVNDATGEVMDIIDTAHSSTVIRNIDMSDLNGVVGATATRGVIIDPDDACTIENIQLPSIYSDGIEHGILLNNSSDASINNIKGPRYSIVNTIGAVHSLYMHNGAFSNVNLSGSYLYAPNTTSSQDVVVHECAGLNITGMITEDVTNFKYSTDIQLGGGKGMGTYDFTTHGVIDTGDDYVLGYIPSYATVTRVYYEVTKTFTSSGDAAELGIGITSDDVEGIVPGKQILHADNIWDDANTLVDSSNGDVIQDGTLTNACDPTTAIRSIVLHNVVGGEDLTEGAITVMWEYVETGVY